MTSSPHGPPQLGADDVVRFFSAQHFLDEYAQNLRLGRLFVRTKRTFSPQSRVTVSIEGPGVEWQVGATAVVLLSRGGYLGLEIESFGAEVGPTLELLAEEVRARLDAPPLVKRSLLPREEVTVIGAVPSLGALRVGQDDSESEVEESGELSGPGGTRIDTNPYLSTMADTRATVPPEQEAEHETPRGQLRGAASAEDEDPDDHMVSRKLVVPPIPESRTVKQTREDGKPEPRPSVLDLIDTTDGAAKFDRAPAGLPPPSIPPAAADSSNPDAPTGSIVLPSQREVAAARAEATVAMSEDLAPTHGQPQLAAIAPAELKQSAELARSKEILADAALKIPRVSAAGLLRAPDVGDLLGWYLAALRHGVITVYGGPDGAVGDQTQLKIASRRVVTLEARILARVGDWVTLQISSSDEVQVVLRDLADEWREALASIAPPSIQVIAPEPPAPSIAPPVRPSNPPAEPAKLVPSAPPPPVSDPPKVVLPASLEVAGAPEAPRLEGDIIYFKTPRDLSHEIETNLKSGGLFAISDPIPIRSRRSLRVALGGIDTGVRIEADVVFAAAGRVGFSVNGFSDVLSQLDRALKQAADPSHSIPGPPIMASLPPTMSIIPPAGIPSIAPPAQEKGALPERFEGRLGRPLAKAEFLEPSRYRVDSEEDLDHATALFLFDAIARNKMRGVLTLKRKDEVRTIYFHEGSVAFVEARPVVEEHCLGRILVGAKKLNDTALKEGIERARATRTPLGRVLISLGKVSAATLVGALREQTRLKVEVCFEWPSGTFEWGPWQEPPTKADLVVTSGLGILIKYFRHLYEHASTAEVEEIIAQNITRVVIPSPDADLQSPVLALQPKEMRFIEMSIDGKRNIGEVITGSPLGRLASLRLIAFGLSSSILSFKDGPRRIASKREPRQASDGRGYTAVKRALEEDVKMLRGQNYFEILGVHWSAHYRTYPAAFNKARARFDNTRAELREAPADVQRLAREALEIVEGAFKTLINEGDRIRYRKQLFDATEREYSADMLVKQGEVLILRGDRIGGIEAFETAVELAPTPRNRTMLAQAREGRSLS